MRGGGRGRRGSKKRLRQFDWTGLGSNLLLIFLLAVLVLVSPWLLSGPGAVLAVWEFLMSCENTD